MNRAAHSFFAAFVGWLLPFVGYLAWLQFNSSGFGYITDFGFLLFWPLLLTFVGWAAVALPMSLNLWKDQIPTLGKTILISTTATTGTFLLIAAWFRFGLIWMLWWPVLIGLIGGAIFWLLEKWHPRHVWTFWLIPILFFPFVRLVALPIAVNQFPYITHVLAEGAISPEARINVIKRIQVGDHFNDLQVKYPKFFTTPVKNTSFSGGGWEYYIRFDHPGGQVVEVSAGREENTDSKPSDNQKSSPE
ncbi:MAG: hypothetical protein AAF591_12930 [Verrucomicrobiota bacterium]